MKSSVFLTSIFFLSLFLLLSGTLQCQGNVTAPAYDLSKPSVIELPKPLKEVSGIVMSQNRLFAISDDKGQVFELNHDEGKITKQWSFGEADDYEDVAVVEDKFFVLNSNGDLVSFSLPATGSPSITEFKFPFGKGNEFEILYYDRQSAHLIMICKECKGDGIDQLSAYTVNPATGNYKQAPFKISADAVYQKSTKSRERLKPSAAAIHPVTGEVYMISSINKLLIRMNLNGKVIAVHPLKRSVFEQPEGITFTANGDMLISNEAGQKDHATLLMFRYNPN